MVAIIGLLAAGTGDAQTPAGADQGSPPGPVVGDAFDYRTSHGRRLRMLLAGTDGDRFLWELHDVTGTPVLAARITQDAAFRVLVHEDAAGGITRYDPHNCEKIVGICTYAVTHPDGTVDAEMRVNGIESGVWN
jgi:hypothetical protein